MPDLRAAAKVVPVALALAAFPFLVKDPFWQHVAVLVMVMASLATAWNILGGLSGQVSFGHSIFFAVGAYSTAYLLIHARLSPWLGMTAGAVLAVGLGLVIGVPVFRLRRHHFSIATIAMQQVLLVVVANTPALGSATGLEVPFAQPSLANLQFSIRDQTGYHLVALGLLGLCSLVYWWFAAGRAGAYARAIRDDEDVARALGVRAQRIKLQALLLSAALTALVGGFYAMYALFVDPNVVLSLGQSIGIVLVAVLGGVGRAWGPLVGAVILVVIQETTRVQLSSRGSGLDLVIYGAIVILIAVVQPGGLIGLWERVGGSLLGVQAKSALSRVRR